MKVKIEVVVEMRDDDYADRASLIEEILEVINEGDYIENLIATEEIKGVTVVIDSPNHDLLVATEGERIDHGIERLAAAITARFPNEIKKGSGAVDTAIRLIEEHCHA